MLNPSNIIRSKRKTLSLYISPHGELIVKAPLRLSEYKIYEFVKSKEQWIRTRQAAILQDGFINKSVLSYNTFLFLGDELKPIVCDKAKRVSRSGEILFVPAKFAVQGDLIVRKKIQKWIKDNAKIIVGERCQYFSQVLGLGYAEAKINNNKSRWGSCGRDRVISINWRAAMLKPKLLDYIIVHEFCHLLEFNHSKSFWNVVETILPNWKVLRKELKCMNWLIELFRF